MAVNFGGPGVTPNLGSLVSNSLALQPGDLQLMKEIDGFLNDDEGREALDSAEHLKRMLECSDKAGQIHHPVAKKKVPVPI